MSREIKFRALYKGHFVSGNLIIGEYDGVEFYEIEQSLSYDFQKWRVDKNTVGQYTGLKDKNGKEIYEGDRIRYANSMEHGEGVISFSAGFIIEWDLSTVKTEHPMIMSPLFYFQCSAEIEIIGNIHQNPELLKGGGDE